MSRKYKDLVSRSIQDVWNEGNFDVIEDYVSSDFVVHGSIASGDTLGPDGIREYFATLRRAFPDLHFTIESQIAEDDLVVTHWEASGTNTGEFQGMPPTGKQCQIAGHDIDRIANGKIVECWSLFDELGLFIELGIVPSPEPAKP